jgi:hypothetical protein
MRIDQYQALIKSQKADFCAIHADELDVPSQDRTLLYGYTCDRDTFHVYLMDGVLHRVIYNHDNKVLSHEMGQSLSPYLLAPNKRAYPETCDEQFCRLMITRGQEISFTTFNEMREPSLFHGKIREELID